MQAYGGEIHIVPTITPTPYIPHYNRDNHRSVVDDLLEAIQELKGNIEQK